MSDRFTGYDAAGKPMTLAAFVENVDRNTLRIHAAPGFELVVMQIPNKPLEVAVVGNLEMWHLKVRAPTELETLAISYPVKGTIEFKYGDLFDVG